MRDFFKIIFIVIFGGGFLLMIIRGVQGLIKSLMGKTAKTSDVKTESAEEKEEEEIDA